MAGLCVHDALGLYQSQQDSMLRMTCHLPALEVPACGTLLRRVWDHCW